MLKSFKYFNKVLSPKEQKIVWICLVVICVNLGFLVFSFFKSHIKLVPVEGGEYTEGLVGAPQYINPLYSNISDVDSDISSLIFSALLKRDKNNSLVNDLAKFYEVSEDGKTYTFLIKDNVLWHNGETLTVDDIIYTFNAIKDAQYQSTLRSSFAGVEIKKVDEATIEFNLPEPYAAFLDLLDFGIIPEHLWYPVPPASAGLAELNLKPIGSGPYKFKSLAKDKLGAIKLYALEANENYYLDKPKITKLNFKFFPSFNEAANAMNEGLVDGLSYLPAPLKKDIKIKEPWNFYTLDLAQVTSIFFNQDKNANLKNKDVRAALAKALNKNKLVEELGGDYRLIDGPILPSNFAYNPENAKYSFNKDEASASLENAGYKLEEITLDDLIVATSTPLKEENNKAEGAEKENEDNNEEEEEDVGAISQEELKALELKQKLGPGAWRYKEADNQKEYLIIELTTVDIEENIQAANAIKNNWEAIGVKTILKIIPVSQIQANVIRGRDFEALFYGAVLGSDPDSYAFWHSSQAEEGGLNIANYKNKTVDKLLEEGRSALDKVERVKKYQEFQKIITQDLPVIFVYAPTYTYIQSKKIKGFWGKNIFTPRDRFSDIAEWHIMTGRDFVW